MQHPGSLKIEDYTYDLPEERIAKYPLEQRDASKLLVWNKGAIKEDTYRNISNHIPESSLLVFNQTKVVHARLLFKKPTGGGIEIFCLEPHEQYADVQTAMLQKQKVWWKCLVGGAAKWKQYMLLKLAHANPDFNITASIIERQPGYFIIEMNWDSDATFAEVLHHAGKVPLPPYINREADIEDSHRYQTIYAKQEGSVAAPTAGLHFTNEVMGSLAAKDIATSFVTLHVGAGTFKPVKTATMQEHDMHAEWIDVDIDTLHQLQKHIDTGIVAVGTTSMRTLESLYWIGAQLLQHIPPVNSIAVTQWLPYELKTDASPQQALQAIIDWLLQNHQERLLTRTQIFIAPGYEPKMIKGLVTNFHQPQSTLLLLIAALIGDSWKDMYHYALTSDYRFLSYGDGCFIEI